MISFPHVIPPYQQDSSIIILDNNWEKCKTQTISEEDAKVKGEAKTRIPDEFEASGTYTTCSKH